MVRYVVDIRLNRGLDAGATANLGREAFEERRIESFKKLYEKKKVKC